WPKESAARGGIWPRTAPPRARAPSRASTFRDGLRAIGRSWKSWLPDVHSFSRLAAFPFRFVPASIRRRFVQVVTRAAAERRPEEALRELLTMDADLSGQIDLASLAYGDGVHVKHRLMRYHDFFVERI